MTCTLCGHSISMNMYILTKTSNKTSKAQDEACGLRIQQELLDSFQ